MKHAAMRIGVGAVCAIAGLTCGTFLNPPVEARAQAQAPGKAAQAEDLAGLAAGAIVVQGAKSPGATAEAWYMLDEDPTTGRSPNIP